MGLDGVELVMAWEEGFGVAITDPEGEIIRTPRMAVDLICRKLGVADGSGAGGCLSQRAFHRVRAGLRQAFGVPRAAIRPGTALTELLPAGQRRQRWRTLQAAVGAAAFPGTLFGWTVPSSLTVGELAATLVARNPNHFRHQSEPWTRAQVRAVLRAIVTDQLGIREFGDGDDFVRDLGID